MRIRNLLLIAIIFLTIPLMNVSALEQKEIVKLEEENMKKIYNCALLKTSELGNLLSLSIFKDTLHSIGTIGDDLNGHLQDIEIKKPLRAVILWPTTKFNSNVVIDEFQIETTIDFSPDLYIPTFVFQMFYRTNSSMMNYSAAQILELACLYDTLMIEGFSDVAYVVFYYGQGKPQIATAFYKTDKTILTKTGLIYYNQIDEQEDIFVTMAYMFGPDTFDMITINMDQGGDY